MVTFGSVRAHNGRSEQGQPSGFVVPGYGRAPDFDRDDEGMVAEPDEMRGSSPHLPIPHPVRPHPTQHPSSLQPSQVVLDPVRGDTDTHGQLTPRQLRLRPQVVQDSVPCGFLADPGSVLVDLGSILAVLGSLLGSIRIRAPASSGIGGLVAFGERKPHPQTTAAGLQRPRWRRVAGVVAQVDDPPDPPPPSWPRAARGRSRRGGRRRRRSGLACTSCTAGPWSGRPA